MSVEQALLLAAGFLLLISGDAGAAVLGVLAFTAGIAWRS